MSLAALRIALCVGGLLGAIGSARAAEPDSAAAEPVRRPRPTASAPT